ncbi:unnamed protein product [Eruca vesicaria subsp. sativa]|uniref:WEB family protein n=1 Tax=Eruca vesicaria subsp. sativa TaxID=29727 RepID=A0ABC8L7X2_ERUVS|nr:unnamed protein product [Eruca vesicaria subsp. sativa]
MEMKAMEESDHVDTSRPFSSVKEAVAIFGQRITLPGQTHTVNHKPVSPRINHTVSLPSSPWKQRPSLPSFPQGPKEEFMDVLKKLEAEITETKTEVKKLKERESETEVALATLNAEMHKNMSKMAKAEADAAGKSAAAAMAKSVSVKETKEKENGDEERRNELMRKMAREYPTLAQILDSNRGDRNGYFGKKKKKKPIVPLLGDFFFFKKKDSSVEISGPLFTTSSTLRF